MERWSEYEIKGFRWKGEVNMRTNISEIEKLGHEISYNE